MTTTKRSHTIQNESESLALLRRATIGRLAVVVGDRPDIFPVNFVVDHGSVVFRTEAGTKLAAATGQQVAFETDGYDADTGEAWSVVLKGTAHEVCRLDEVVDALSLPLSSSHPGAKPRIVRIERESITGRRFVAEVETPVSTVSRAAYE